MPLFTSFVLYCILMAAKVLLFLGVILSMRKVMKQMIFEHTGSITEVGNNTAKTENIRKGLRKWLLTVMIVGAAAVLMSAATAVLFLWIPILQSYDALVWSVFAAVLYYFMNRLISSVDDRYYHET
jgi:hypothetical protein